MHLYDRVEPNDYKTLLSLRRNAGFFFTGLGRRTTNSEVNLLLRLSRMFKRAVQTSDTTRTCLRQCFCLDSSLWLGGHHRQVLARNVQSSPHYNNQVNMMTPAKHALASEVRGPLKIHATCLIHALTQ